MKCPEGAEIRRKEDKKERIKSGQMVRDILLQNQDTWLAKGQRRLKTRGKGQIYENAGIG